MSEASENRLPVALVDVPPERYPVPASMLDDDELVAMTPVTVGGPGWWVVDELLLVTGEVTLSRGVQCLPVLPAPEWGWARGESAAVAARYLPLEDLWIYRDSPATREQVPSFDPLAWHGRVMTHSDEPPPLRRARPARELPSLVGRTVRWRTSSGEWRWLKLLSEPLASGSEFTVSACDPADYWRAIYHRDPDRAWVIQIPLHAAWTY